MASPCACLRDLIIYIAFITVPRLHRLSVFLLYVFAPPPPLLLYNISLIATLSASISIDSSFFLLHLSRSSFFSPYLLAHIFCAPPPSSTCTSTSTSLLDFHIHPLALHLLLGSTSKSRPSSSTSTGGYPTQLPLSSSKTFCASLSPPGLHLCSLFSLLLLLYRSPLFSSCLLFREQTRPSSHPFLLMNAF